MKILASLAVVLALAGACTSASDRPRTSDERHARIERERQRAQPERRESRAEMDARDDSETELDRDPDPGRDRTIADADDMTGHEPDNTGVNERDDEPGSLTALDQSNSASDIDITQAIRKKVIAHDALSFNAKNVKIITVGGKVTLRGPVESAQESSVIEQSARGVPGVQQVVNQIEVKR